MDALDFVEAQAANNAAFHLETLEILQKRAHALVTLLLGGAGALGAYGLSLVEKGAAPWVVAALFGASAWLFVVALLGVNKCLVAQDVMPPFNEPKSLLIYGDNLTAMRNAELKRLQDELENYGRKGANTGRWLNRCYRAAACSPFIAVASSFLALGLARVW